MRAAVGTDVRWLDDGVERTGQVWSIAETNGFRWVVDGDQRTHYVWMRDLEPVEEVQESLIA